MALRKEDDEEDGQQQLAADDEILTLSEDGKTAEAREEKPVPEGEDREGEEDERLAAGTEHQGRTPEERAARKAARKAAKDHKRQREAQERAELAELRRQNAVLAAQISSVQTQVGGVQQAVVGNIMATVESRIAEATRIREQGERDHAAAITASDGVRASEALKAIRLADNALFQLNDYKTRAAQAQQQETQQRQQQGTASAQQVDQSSFDRLSRQFLADNPWIDMTHVVDGRSDDPDIQEALDIDAAVERAGYKRDTAAYWNEFQRRVDNAFPDKLDDLNAQTQGRARTQPANGTRRRGPAMGGGRSAALGERDILVPRVAADMYRDAGYFKTPEDRADMAKRLKESQAKYGARR